MLRGINLEVRRGDVIAVLGANGAGKTTLVKHAIGLLKPRSGRVLVDGRDTKEASVAQIAGTLGYVFQSPSHMLFAPTVREELAFGPTNLKHQKVEIEKEVKEALEIVNLVDNENDPPLALSFGQQKRVSIAAILAMRSRVLVMDEPTAGQDYQNYMSFMDSILQMPGFEAVIFITHDVDLAVIYANRVLLVAGGRLMAMAGRRRCCATSRNWRPAALSRPRCWRLTWSACRRPEPSCGLRRWLTANTEESRNGKPTNKRPDLPRSDPCDLRCDHVRVRHADNWTVQLLG